jgi:hypothetical protein
MASITTRATTGTGATVKGLPLTNAEIDNNFISLNDNKLEATWTGNTSIVTLGTVTTGTWNATTIATLYGGTGLTSFTNGGAVYASSTSALTTGTLPIASGGTGITTTPTSGSLLVGTSAGAYTSTTLTGTSNRITVTNTSGTITLSTPQDIATGSNPQFNSMGIGQASSGTAGNIIAISITETSSERLKENIVPITNALHSILQLNGVNFDWKDKTTGAGKQAGLIAEQVAPIIPEVVDYDSEGQSTGIQYGKLVAYLIEAVKELKEEIDVLKGNK